MRIALIAPLFEAVPPVTYGGTERVVSALATDLVHRGHEVTLFASRDSRTPARLVPVTPTALRQSDAIGDQIAPHITMLSRISRLANQFDIIHNHVDYFAFPFIAQWPVPTVTTLHGRLDLPELEPLYREYSDLHLISISDSQRGPLAHLPLRWVATVYNGVVCDHFPIEPTTGDYLVFVGRISPEKRPDLAIQVAERSGLPLKIAAKVDPFDEQWHVENVVPLLDHPLIEFVGEVDEAGKAELLAGARTLLFPSRWPEPFGMVMVEAMACGTPVIALRHGSIPEVIVHGETGFICDNADEMVDAVARVDQIDQAACRRHVESSFSSRAMVDGYEAAYERVVSATGAPRGLALPGHPAAAEGHA